MREGKRERGGPRDRLGESKRGVRTKTYHLANVVEERITRKHNVTTGKNYVERAGNRVT